MREKFRQWKTNIFDNHLCVKYKNFYSMKEVNRYHKILFYQEDFESLTHPKFWNLESNILNKKELSRNRSRRSSISQCLYGYKRSRCNSEASNKTTKSRGYISKKLAKQLAKEEESRRQLEKAELEKKLREEEEWRNSKHI